GFGGVQIFRLLIPHRPAAEADDPAATVGDRKDHAAAEIFIVAAVVGLLDQPRLARGLDSESVAAQRTLQRSAPIGSETQPVTRDRRIVDPPPAEIVERRLPLRQTELLRKPG